MLRQLRGHLDYFAGITSDGPPADPSAVVAFADMVRELLGEPTNVQALALARLIRDFEANGATLFTHAFDLPEGYWAFSVKGRTTDLVGGIAPDGSVSS